MEAMQNVNDVLLGRSIFYQKIVFKNQFMEGPFCELEEVRS